MITIRAMRIVESRYQLESIELNFPNVMQIVFAMQNLVFSIF